MSKIAIIAGATGLVGKQLMFQLLENKEFAKVIVLVRREMAIKHHKLAQVLIDFDQIDQLKIVDNIDVAFCCLGTTIKIAGTKEAFYKVDFTYVSKFAHWAKSNTIPRFLFVSSNGANPKSTIFYSKVKGEIEFDLQSQLFEYLTILRPSLLVGNRSETRLGEKIGYFLGKIIGPFLFGDFKKYKPIESLIVAKALMNRSISQNIPLEILESDQIKDLID